MRRATCRPEVSSGEIGEAEAKVSGSLIYLQITRSLLLRYSVRR